jgi:hypothetical protein
MRPIAVRLPRSPLRKIGKLLGLRASGGRELVDRVDESGALGAKEVMFKSLRPYLPVFLIGPQSGGDAAYFSPKLLSLPICSIFARTLARTKTSVSRKLGDAP